jgi:hypothetical protein
MLRSIFLAKYAIFSWQILILLSHRSDLLSMCCIVPKLQFWFLYMCVPAKIEEMLCLTAQVAHVVSTTEIKSRLRSQRVTSHRSRLRQSRAAGRL